jgi:hypothetical protein
MNLSYYIVINYNNYCLMFKVYICVLTGMDSTKPIELDCINHFDNISQKYQFTVYYYYYFVFRLFADLGYI